MCARAIRVYLSVFCSEISTSLPGLCGVKYETKVSSIFLSPGLYMSRMIVQRAKPYK